MRVLPHLGGAAPACVLAGALMVAGLAAAARADVSIGAPGAAAPDAAAFAPAEDAVRLEPGTVLEIYAVGVPEFRFRVPVNAAGEASFPLLDPMTVAGLSLEALRGVIKRELPSKVYRQRTGGGGTEFVNFLPGEIVVEIAEYPPAYVTGDVAQPGEIEYQPNLTVRQAIALAGGYDTIRATGGDPRMTAAVLQGEFNQAWITLATAEARRLGIDALLADASLDTVRGRIEAPLPAASLDEIVRVETDRLQALETHVRDNRAHEQALAAEAQQQLARLEDERAVVEQRLEDQTEATQRVRDMFQKGVVPSSRFAEEQRYLAVSQDRALALTSQISALQRDIQQSQWQDQALREEHRIDLLTDLRQARADIEAQRSRIRTLDAQLALTGQPQVGPAGVRRQILVHRREEGGAFETVVVEEDAPIRASDVVEVSLGDVFDAFGATD